jgi:hypothetical protein
MPLSHLQQLFIRIFPASWAQEMEAESRDWMVRCHACGFERSLWETGGIRWKKKGNSRTWTWGRCPNCGKLSWHTVHRREDG